MTKSFLPDSCLRKYPEFEDLLCLGCAPLESKYVVGDNKDTLRLCKKFALALWNATTEEELNQPTKRFDNCGFLVPDGFHDTQNSIQQEYALNVDATIRLVFNLCSKSLSILIIGRALLVPNIFNKSISDKKR